MFEGLVTILEDGLPVGCLQRDGRRPTQAEFRRFSELEKRRDAHAQQLAIDPTIIAPRATLGELARDWDAHAPELMNWQRELLK